MNFVSWREVIVRTLGEESGVRMDEVCLIADLEGTAMGRQAIQFIVFQLTVSSSPIGGYG